jgi:2-polyprenyl-6-methoxyphenol hydroxylase-like FAD-dependent oxidoreductase
MTILLLALIMMQAMKIVIVGGGIGGLSLARELALRGMRSTVLERAPQLNPIGAGIIMNPNAMRVLEKNGLADAVRRDSWPYLTRETRDATGRPLATPARSTTAASSPRARSCTARTCSMSFTAASRPARSRLVFQ